MVDAVRGPGGPLHESPGGPEPSSAELNLNEAGRLVPGRKVRRQGSAIQPLVIRLSVDQALIASSGRARASAVDSAKRRGWPLWQLEDAASVHDDLPVDQVAVDTAELLVVNEDHDDVGALKGVGE